MKKLRVLVTCARQVEVEKWGRKPDYALRPDVLVGDH